MNNFFKSLDTQPVPKIGQSGRSCDVVALCNVAGLEFVQFFRLWGKRLYERVGSREINGLSSSFNIDI